MCTICDGIRANITAGLPKLKVDEDPSGNLQIFSKAHRATSKRELMDDKQRKERTNKNSVVAPSGNKKGKSKLAYIHIAGLAMNIYGW